MHTFNNFLQLEGKDRYTDEKFTAYINNINNINKLSTKTKLSSTKNLEIADFIVALENEKYFSFSINLQKYGYVKQNNREVNKLDDYKTTSGDYSDRILGYIIFYSSGNTGHYYSVTRIDNTFYLIDSMQNTEKIGNIEDAIIKIKNYINTHKSNTNIQVYPITLNYDKIFNNNMVIIGGKIPDKRNIISLGLGVMGGLSAMFNINILYIILVILLILIVYYVYIKNTDKKLDLVLNLPLTVTSSNKDGILECEGYGSNWPYKVICEFELPNLELTNSITGTFVATDQGWGGTGHNNVRYRVGSNKISPAFFIDRDKNPSNTYTFTIKKEELNGLVDNNKITFWLCSAPWGGWSAHLTSCEIVIN